MPFIRMCSKCQTVKTFDNFRNRWHCQNKKWYLVSHCKDCEKESRRSYQRKNLEYFRQQNRKYYKQWSEEYRNKRLLESHKRHKRLKSVGWDLELTDFVTTEAHELRKFRNLLTNFKWHVDHIIPLNGEIVSGLHVWNNLAVIPAVENLRKGNSYSFHEKRS